MCRRLTGSYKQAYILDLHGQLFWLISHLNGPIGNGASAKKFRVAADRFIPLIEVLQARTLLGDPASLLAI
jgi:hypothetical protein